MLPLLPKILRIEAHLAQLITIFQSYEQF